MPAFILYIAINLRLFPHFFKCNKAMSHSLTRHIKSTSVTSIIVFVDFLSYQLLKSWINLNFPPIKANICPIISARVTDAQRQTICSPKNISCLFQTTHLKNKKKTPKNRQVPERLSIQRLTDYGAARTYRGHTRQPPYQWFWNSLSSCPLKSMNETTDMVLGMAPRPATVHISRDDA